MRARPGGGTPLPASESCQASKPESPARASDRVPGTTPSIDLGFCAASQRVLLSSVSLQAFLHLAVKSHVSHAWDCLMASQH